MKTINLQNIKYPIKLVSRIPGCDQIISVRMNGTKN